MSEQEPTTGEAAATENAGATAFQRRIFVIDKEFQYRFLATWLIMTVGYVIAILAVMTLGVSILNTLGTEKFGPLREPVMELLDQVLKLNAGFIVLLTVLFSLYAIYFSHRIAGPAYKLLRSMQRLATGDVDFKVILRRKDYLKDVAGEMNLVLEDLQERRRLVEHATEAAGRLSSQLEGLEAATPEMRLLAGQVREQLEQSISVREPAPEADSGSPA